MSRLFKQYMKRLGKIINDPRNIKKVVPFINSRIIPVKRRLLEKIGIVETPFSGHDEFIKHIHKGGFFVQVGGMDGYSNDPTYYLEKKLDWRGIIVEPMEVATVCQKNRKKSKVYQCACGSFEEENTWVKFVDCYGMSFLEGAVENEKEWIKMAEESQGLTADVKYVNVLPVQNIIDAYFRLYGSRPIDLLVLDVEGYELEVLKGLDFKRNKPSLILLESGSIAKTIKITNFLNRRHYKMIDRFGNDYLFKRT